MAAFLPTFAVAIAKYKLVSAVKYRKFISISFIQRYVENKYVHTANQEVYNSTGADESCGVEIQAIIFRRLNTRAAHIRDRLKACCDIPVTRKPALYQVSSFSIIFELGLFSFLSIFKKNKYICKYKYNK